MGDKRVVVGVARGGGGGGGGDDMGEGMQCMNHPYRRNPGGVCAFCLQEKLGKLVSSSKSSPFFPFQPPPSSSPSPTSFRSDTGGLAPGLASPGGRRTKFPVLPAGHSQKKKSRGDGDACANGGRKVVASVVAATTSMSVGAAYDGGIVLRRSKSVATRTARGLAQGSGIGDSAVADSPRKKSFWSFLYISSASSTSTSSSSAANNSSSSHNVNRRRSTSSSLRGGDRDTADQCASDKLGDKEDAESPSASLGRKVGRSRSVGCGSRSFSGDFLERISTGFGDCTLRRVESHRETKPRSKVILHLDHDDDEQQRPRMRERIKCGGLFGGLAMMSSAYWLSAAATADDDFDSSSRVLAATPASAITRRAATPRGRTRSWGWALASPMRAFRPYSSSSKSPYAINTAASAAPATSIISSINASSKMANGGISQCHKLDVCPLESAPEDF